MAGNNEEPSDLESYSSSSSIAKAEMIGSRLRETLRQIPDHAYKQYSEIINAQFESQKSTDHVDKHIHQETTMTAEAGEKQEDQRKEESNEPGQKSIHVEKRSVQDMKESERVEPNQVRKSTAEPDNDESQKSAEKQLVVQEMAVERRRRRCHRKNGVSISFFPFYRFTGRNLFLYSTISGAVKRRRNKKSSTDVQEMELPQAEKRRRNKKKRSLLLCKDDDGKEVQEMAGKQQVITNEDSSTDDIEKLVQEIAAHQAVKRRMRRKNKERGLCDQDDERKPYFRHEYSISIISLFLLWLNMMEILNKIVNEV